MSTTPRTDAAVQLSVAPGHNIVCPNFARQLERENAELREALNLAFSIKQMSDQQLGDLIENCRKVINSKP